MEIEMPKLIIDPPFVQAAMAGYANRDFCQQILNQGVGMSTLGAYPLDNINNEASLKIIKRGRKEFFIPQPIEKDWINKQFLIQKLSPKQLIAINVRIKTIDKTAKKILAEIGNFVDIIEINAHCRQKEITDFGGGQELLNHPEELVKMIQKIKKLTSLAVGLKIRGYKSKLIEQEISLFERANLDYLHIDCMIPGKSHADVKFIENFSSITGIPVIGNNSVRTINDVEKMINAGAMAVSVARPLLENIKFIEKLIMEWRKSK